MTLKKLSVVGGGQVGTSLVMATAKAFPDCEIVCLDVNPRIEEDFNAALEINGVDARSTTFTVHPGRTFGSDLVILATPVDQFGDAVANVAPFFGPNTVLSDVGSSKMRSMNVILEALKERNNWNTPYVPTHPLNGNAGSGPLTSSIDLFKDKPLIIVPEMSDPPAIEKVGNFWKGLGSEITYLGARDHDRLIGTMSHLEHVIMFAWMKTDALQSMLFAREGNDPGNWIQGMTRIADANPEMWSAIFKDNHSQILKTAGDFRNNLVDLSRLMGRDHVAIEERITYASQYAESVPSPRINALRDENVTVRDALNTSFAGLLSLALTENVMRVSKAVGEDIRPLANPSLKDGMGPVGTDPGHVAGLLRAFGDDVRPLVRPFLREFDLLTRVIETEDDAMMKSVIGQVASDRQLLGAAYDPENLGAVHRPSRPKGPVNLKDYLPTRLP